MRHHCVLEALYRLLIKNEVEKTYVLVNNLAGLILDRNPCKLGVEPVVIVFKRIHFVHLNGVVGLCFVKCLLEFVLPIVFCNHVEELLHDRLVGSLCHLSVLLV